MGYFQCLGLFNTTKSDLVNMDYQVKKIGHIFNILGLFPI